ncbi:MAG: V-type ATPase subunit, partial [Eubacterium sp.]
KAITDILLMPTDVHNIKTILKGQLQRVEVEDLLLEGGGIPLETLLKALEHGDYTLLPDCYRAPLKRLEDVEDPRLISITIDNAAYAQTLKTLAEKKHSDALLQNYYRAKIDFTNILTILRANVLHWDTPTVKPLLITGGEIDQRVLLDSVAMPSEQLVKQLAHGKHSVLIRTILEHYAQDGNLSEAEQKFENAAFDIIHDSRNDSFGIGPLANYLLQRQAEGKALRVMFAGKRSGVKIPRAELGAVI